MDEASAELAAVRQMGDAVEVGREMDRIHRPRMDVKVLALVGIFSPAACFLQNMLVMAQGNGEWTLRGAAFTALPVLLGVLLMTGILFVDYTWLCKRPLTVWIVFLLTAMLPLERIAGREGGAELIQYLLLALFLPAYGGVIYHYRKKRLPGLLLCLAWLEALWNGGWESSYIVEGIRQILQNLQMVGGKGISFPWEGALAFLLLLERFGIVAAAFAVAGLAVMFVQMASGVKKQKNVFGGILGAACLLGLFLPTVLHILCNLGLIPYSEAVIPFLFPGWTANAVCYTLLGLYLSVYRNTDVAA